MAKAKKSTAATHFGKTQTGELRTFDKDGLIVKLKKKMTDRVRDESERIIHKDTHKGLIDRKTWNLAVKKLKGTRTSFSPRNPDYYLKQIFVCGHCGKNMTGRTEIDPSTKERRVVYFCSTYITKKIAGTESLCGAHRITHADAEQMLLDKIRELNVPFDESASDPARDNLRQRYGKLEEADEEALQQLWTWIDEGANALVTYMKKTAGVKGRAVSSLEKLAKQYYRTGSTAAFKNPRNRELLPVALADFKKAVKEAEAAEVDYAREKVAELRKQHKACTLDWVAASAMQREVLKDESDRLEAEIKEWEPRTVPLPQRLKSLGAEDTQRGMERAAVLDEWPKLDAREKGEALRRLFDTVTLYWNSKFNPAEENPKRERKTDRPGRYRYTLDLKRIEWQLGALNLSGSR